MTIHENEICCLETIKPSTRPTGGQSNRKSLELSRIIFVFFKQLCFEKNENFSTVEAVK